MNVFGWLKDMRQGFLDDPIGKHIYGLLETVALVWIFLWLVVKAFQLGG